MWLAVVPLAFLIAGSSAGTLPGSVNSCQFEELRCKTGTKEWCRDPSGLCQGLSECENEEAFCDSLRRRLEPTENVKPYGIGLTENVSVEMCALFCLKTSSCDHVAFTDSRKCFMIFRNRTRNVAGIPETAQFYSLLDDDSEVGRGKRQLFSNPFGTFGNLFNTFFGNSGSSFNNNNGGSSFNNPNRGRQNFGRAIQSSQANSLNSRPFIPRSRPDQCGGRDVSFSPPSPRRGKIINGYEVPDGAFPWQVGIKRREGGSFQHICGGSIVTPTHVISAAHCLVGYDKSLYRIVAGDNSLSSPGPEHQIFDVQSFIIHENYNKKTQYDSDIAVIKLRAPINFGSQVKPICLPPDNSFDVEGTDCVISGWGLTKAGDQSSVSRTLRAATVPLMSSSTCKGKDVMGNLGPFKGVQNGMVCAGYLEGGTDACEGDSGGPLACNVAGRFYLLGITSWGEGCAAPRKPGVYTKVSYYLSWIKARIS